MPKRHLPSVMCLPRSLKRRAPGRGFAQAETGRNNGRILKFGNTEVMRNAPAPICRMPTPHVSSEMIEDSAHESSFVLQCSTCPWAVHIGSSCWEETETYASSGKTVRIFPAADMEAHHAFSGRIPMVVSCSFAVCQAIPASGRRRPSRERQATPFVKDW